MKRFYCQCGQEIFFENSHCNYCGAALGFDPQQLQLLPVAAAADNRVRHGEQLFKRCANHAHELQCNWLLASDDPAIQCRSCRLTHVIPNQNYLRNVRRWSILESAKRRMLYGVLRLQLSLIKADGQPLQFCFLEDQLSNPQVAESQILSGHVNGVITLNAAEADTSYREAAREAMNEPYRTLLGHFRHEVGHFYWERLIQHGTQLATFRQLFGDEQGNYQQALEHYYQYGPQNDWQQNYISAYASAHPLEDWAETWAHYLLMHETLETAVAFALIEQPGDDAEFQIWQSEWSQLVVRLNALNRSIGNADAYPFVISAPVLNKLHFIHDLIRAATAH